MCPALLPPNICPKQEPEEMDMSAPENGKWNEANAVNQENTDARKIKEEPGMSSPGIKNETKLNLETHLAEAKTWLTNASGTITPMKILAGLAAPAPRRMASVIGGSEEGLDRLGLPAGVTHP